MISGLALWLSHNANDGFIVQGGGSASVAVAVVEDGCSVMVSLPLEFHNSGNRALTLRRFIPGSIDKVLSTKDSTIDIW